MVDAFTVITVFDQMILDLSESSVTSIIMPALPPSKKKKGLRV